MEINDGQFLVFDLLWQTPSSRAHNIVLSYITKHLISFVPLENFKVHIEPFVLWFQQHHNCCIDFHFVLNDTKNIDFVTKQTNQGDIAFRYMLPLAWSETSSARSTDKFGYQL